MRIAVVGGGVVGLVVAGDLARRGTAVTLWERDTLGSGATGRAAGICYDAFADDVDAAVADRALERYRQWELLDSCPYVWGARTEADAAEIRRQVQRMQANGRDVELVEPDPLGDRFPALDTSAITVAGVAPDAGVVDPDGVIDALASRAREAGVTIETESPVSLSAATTIETPAGRERYDAVVVAAGPATAPLVADCDIALALKTYRSQALVTDPIDEALPSYYDATETFYWRPHGDALLVGGGTHEVTPDDWDRDADPEFVESVLASVDATTACSPGVSRAWTGLCTATPDRDPLIGSVDDGLWVATGWQGQGLMRAPALGEYLACAVLAEASPLAVDLPSRVDPTRFDGTESFDAVGDPTRDW